MENTMHHGDNHAINEQRLEPNGNPPSWGYPMRDDRPIPRTHPTSQLQANNQTRNSKQYHHQPNNQHHSNNHAR